MHNYTLWEGRISPAPSNPSSPARRASSRRWGRAAVLRLLPLSRREREGRPGAPLHWERTSRIRTETPPEAGSFWRCALDGGYPELATDPNRDGSLWFASYVQTYLERDVRTLRQVGDLTQFQMFLRALAARSAQLLNLTDLGRDLGLAINTVKAWVSVLEASHQIVILRPHFANVTKRLVKTPKAYFTDSGILCHLVGLKDPARSPKRSLSVRSSSRSGIAAKNRASVSGAPRQAKKWTCSWRLRRVSSPSR